MSRMCQKNNIFLILFAVIIYKPDNTSSVHRHRVKREENCPVFNDPKWKSIDSHCPTGKQYHCFEDGNGNIFTRGCFKAKLCQKGSHPVVEGNVIVCDYCKKGFQLMEGLPSNEYRFSYCQPHSPDCKPRYGQTQCREGTRDRDRACTCDAALGFSPGLNSSQCQCFTSNDPCPQCKFTGCPRGSVRNDKGYCEPEKSKTMTSVTMSTSPRSTTTEMTAAPPADDRLPDWASALIAVVILMYIIPWIILCLFYRKHLSEMIKRRHGSETTVESQASQQMNEELAGCKFIFILVILPWLAVVKFCRNHPSPGPVPETEGSEQMSLPTEPERKDPTYINQYNYITDAGRVIFTLGGANMGSDGTFEISNGTHTPHISSRAQNGRSHSDDLAESASIPMPPDHEEAESLLPTSPPTVPPPEPTTPPTISPSFGPRPQPSPVAEPSASHEESEPLLPAVPSVGLPPDPTVPPPDPTAPLTVSPPLGPPPQPLSATPSAPPESLACETDPLSPPALHSQPVHPTCQPSPVPEPSAPPPSLPHQVDAQNQLVHPRLQPSPALEPSAPPPSLPHQDAQNQLVHPRLQPSPVSEPSAPPLSLPYQIDAENETISLTGNSEETSVEQQGIQGVNSMLGSANRKVTYPVGSSEFGPNLSVRARIVGAETALSGGGHQAITP